MKSEIKEDLERSGVNGLGQEDLERCGCRPLYQGDQNGKKKTSVLAVVKKDNMNTKL
jgi:hypothetical protein